MSPEHHHVVIDTIITVTIITVIMTIIIVIACIPAAMAALQCQVQSVVLIKYSRSKQFPA